jgi:hypothetical protein
MINQIKLKHSVKALATTIKQIFRTRTAHVRFYGENFRVRTDAVEERKTKYE